MADLVFSTIILVFTGLLILAIVAGAIYSIIEAIQDGMNNLYKCFECGLAHRFYQRELSKNKSSCPHCDSRNFSSVSIESDENSYKNPFAPKMSTVNIIKLKKLIKDNKKNDFLDEQIEKYLILQEKKLKEFQKKKDEMIKSEKLND